MDLMQQTFMQVLKLAGKTLYITSVSHGIGKSIVAKAVQDGAKVVGGSKTAMLHRTIFTGPKEAAGFKMGDLTLSGNKAGALEALMKVSRGEKSFHTVAVRYNADQPPVAYESVTQVFDAIKGVANEEIVNQVKAIYLFDVEEEGKYYLDFKNGAGDVGKGDPSSKADVTIAMNTTNFLKIFNRQLSPATAFMTGQIKVSGDLPKALTLEKVMKAAAEAQTKK